MSASGQIAIVLFLILVSSDIILIIRHDSISISILDSLTIGVLHLAFLFFALRSLLPCIAKKSLVLPAKKQVTDSLPIIVLVLLFFIISLFQFTRIPYGDGNGYYLELVECMSKFSLSPASIITDLRLYSHASQGIILFEGPAQLIAGWPGAHFMQAVLTSFTLFFVYEILKRLFKEVPSYLLAIGTALFAFNPYILGLTSQFSPDLYNTIFIIWAVYFFLREWDFLFAFSLVLIYLSKESGILVIGVFTICAILFRISAMGEGSFFARARKYLWPGKLILYALPELMLLIPGLWYYPRCSMTTGSSAVNVIGFALDNYATHLLQITIFNFFWIGLLLVFVALVLRIYRKSRANSRVIITDPGAFFGLISGFSILLLFLSVAFISTPCPRYSQPFAFFWAVIITASVLYIFRSRRVQTALLLAILSLFTIQTYTTIDPSMFNNTSINLGYQNIYAPCKGYVAADCTLILLNELYGYNRQGTYADELMNDALKYISPDPDTQFAGFWIDYNEDYRAGSFVWDSKKQTITPDVSPNTFPLNFTELSIDLIESDTAPDIRQDFYMILPAHETGDFPSDFDSFGMPQSEMWPAFLIRKGFVADDIRVFSNRDGYLTVYHFLPPENQET